jgi:oligoribonuclease (3'-5' exoribonuclease)
VSAPCLILTALATSGLRPNYDQPLELGLLAVDRETFEPVDMFVETLYADPTSLFSDADEKVVEMHTANGLFEALVAAMPARFSSFDHAARAVELKAVEFIEANRATGECRSPLICFGTDWTHRWLSSRFPKLVPNFRGDLDMSTVLNVLGQQRKRGDGRAESTLTELYSVVKQIAPRE